MYDIIKEIPISGIGAIFSIISASYGYILWRHRRFVEAADLFRDAFINTLSDLETTSIDTFEIISRDFPIHNSAVTRFNKFLWSIYRDAFLDTWYKYAYYEDMQKHPFPFLEKYTGGSVGEKKHLRNIAIKHIKDLLSFCDYY